MAVAIGAVSVSNVTSSSMMLQATVSAGTAPFSIAWYKSTVPAFVPGPATLAATTPLAADGVASVVLSGLIPGTQYYVAAIVTDAVPNTATAADVMAPVTLPPILNPNAFSQLPYLGVLDLRFNSNTVAAQIDVSAGMQQYYWGQAMKMVPNTSGGLPKVIGCVSKSDPVFGFINFDIKSLSYSAGQNCEISLWGNVMYLYATGAVVQGQPAYLDITTIGGVQAAGNAASLVGSFYDGAASGGQLVRVMLVPNPAFAVG